MIRSQSGSALEDEGNQHPNSPVSPHEAANLHCRQKKEGLPEETHKMSGTTIAA
jgi:hypothetical protein